MVIIIMEKNCREVECVAGEAGDGGRAGKMIISNQVVKNGCSMKEAKTWGQAGRPNLGVCQTPLLEITFSCTLFREDFIYLFI